MKEAFIECVWGEEGGRLTRNVILDIIAFWNILLPLQDPKEEGRQTSTKKCKLGPGPGPAKQPAYEPAGEAPSKKQPRVAREDDNSISVLLSSEEQLENLVSSQAMYL